MEQTYPLEGQSWTKWQHALREVQLKVLFRHIPLGPHSAVLEIGSGDGFQLGLLRQRFDRVFAIDPTCRPGGSLGFSFAVAEALPFRNAAFDLVVSNSVFEHLEDRRRALNEIVRVLRPGGFMACDVPSRWWKATSLLLNPVGYPLRVWEKWRAAEHAARNLPAAASASRGARPGVGEIARRWFWPPVHGTYTSHLSEFHSYGLEQWRGTLSHPELVPVATAATPWHTQFGFLRFRFAALRRWVGHNGLNGTWVFVMRKR